MTNATTSESLSPTSCADPLSLLADRLDPPDLDVFALLEYEPTPPQQRFHDAGEFDVGYGGALGGGKSYALTIDAVAKAQQYPMLRAGLFRRTYPELEDSIVASLAKIGFARSLGATWSKSKRELHLPNGSVVACRYCETIADATRYQGAEFQYLGLDERTLLAPDVVEFLESRVRSGRPDVPVIGIRSTFNPGGPGHAAVKASHVDATDHGAKTVVDERSGKTRRFIPARATDNPHLDPGYMDRLNSLPDDLRAAFRDGSWDSFVGQVFKEWRYDRHVVAPFNLDTLDSEIRARRAGIDWGYAKPWAVLWGARDGEGRIWIYRETYAGEVGEKDQARSILAAETDEKIAGRHADPSMWNRRGDVHSIADIYTAERCHLLRAENDRQSGWQRVHSYLDEGPACQMHRAQGWVSCPMLHVFESCPNLIRTLPALPYDPHKTEDVDTDAEDHAPDALRYLLMAFGLRPPRKPRTAEDRSMSARADRHFDRLAREGEKRHKRTGSPVGI